LGVEVAGRGECRAAITLLVGEFLPALTAEYQVGKEINLAGNRGRITSVAWCEREDSEASTVSWNDFEGRAVPAGRIDLDFRTPTTFRQGDGQRAWFLPLHEPTALVRSLERQWLTYAGRLPEGWESVCVPVRVDWARIETRMMRAKVPVVGFVGQVALSLVGGTPAQSKGFHALRQAAPYTGIGAKTADGFGYVAIRRVIPLRDGVGTGMVLAAR